jgi:glycosyltransferase involved in cell wall biosynthesis
MNATPQSLKISVVTPSFNQAQFIERTIQSVLNQNYPQLEYIVVDGGSTDGTLDVLTTYQSHLRWISEADRGQAEAINKGFKKASGQIVCWLNADDEYVPDTFSQVANYFSRHPEARFLYGDAETVDETGRAYGRRGNVRPANFQDLASQGDFIVQPAAFWRADLLNEVGLLDETLRYCLDYEYWLRVSQKYPLHYLPVTLARERFHAQAKTTQATLRRIQEIEAVARRYGNPQIPRRFQAEQTAVYLAETVRQARLAQWSEAKQFGQLTLRSFSPSFRLVPHLLALSLGPKGVTWMRLHYDLFRSKLRFS